MAEVEHLSADVDFDFLGMFEDRIVRLAEKRIPAWNIAFLLGNNGFRVAGGAFAQEEPNDIDIYPLDKDEVFNRYDIEQACKSLKNCKPVYRSKNALTVMCNGVKLQFCDYGKDTLKELIDKFDFWHTQCGVQYECHENLEGSWTTPTIEEVYFTEEWAKYRLTGETHYTGSEFPLSSLIRLGKYIKRDMFKGKSYVPDVFKILSDITDRGYKDYKDFKGQLFAVDLLILDRSEGDAAWGLFKSLWSKGLVESRVEPSSITDAEAGDEDEEEYGPVKDEPEEEEKKEAPKKDTQSSVREILDLADEVDKSE